MDAGDVWQALGLSLGLALGIGFVSLVTGDRPGPGVLLGMAFVPLFFAALTVVDGPLEKRTALVGALVVSGGLVGTAFWLMS